MYGVGRLHTNVGVTNVTCLLNGLLAGFAIPMVFLLPLLLIKYRACLIGGLLFCGCIFFELFISSQIYLFSFNINKRVESKPVLWPFNGYSIRYNEDNGYFIDD